MRFSLLLLFRLLAVWTAVLVGKDLDVILNLLWLFAASIFRDNSQKSASPGNATFLNWDDVDVFRPLQLNDSVAEALRLNELLARKQWKCDDDIRVGDDKGAFTVCTEGGFNMTMREALFISGSPDDYAFYLITVSPEKWTFFVPEGFQVLEMLGDVDAEMHYLFELKDNAVWSVDEILYELSNRRFDTAFISFYSPFIRGQSKKARLEELRDAPKLTEQVLKVLLSKQLQLIVEVDRDAEEVLYSWYSLLYQMYFKYQYALIGAESDSVYDGIVHSCRYRLSFMRKAHHQVDLPVFGFGSPLEEKKRLMQYLAAVKQGNVQCGEVRWSENDMPLLCKVEAEGGACTVTYVRYRRFRTKESFEQYRPCKIHFFSPLKANLRLSTEQNVYLYGISPHLSKNLTVPDEENSSWQLITSTDILNIVNEQRIDSFILDLDGEERDIFPVLLETAQLKKTVLDLEFRVRFWIGEENDNFRRLLMYFLRLEAFGFRKMFSKIVDETTAVVIFRNSELI